MAVLLIRVAEKAQSKPTGGYMSSVCLRVSTAPGLYLQEVLSARLHLQEGSLEWIVLG